MYGTVGTVCSASISWWYTPGMVYAPASSRISIFHDAYCGGHDIYIQTCIRVVIQAGSVSLAHTAVLSLEDRRTER